jgi:hypothetical protein
MPVWRRPASPYQDITFLVTLGLITLGLIPLGLIPLGLIPLGLIPPDPAESSTFCPHPSPLLRRGAAKTPLGPHGTSSAKPRFSALL